MHWTDEEFRILKQSLNFALKHAEQAKMPETTKKQLEGLLDLARQQDYIRLAYKDVHACWHCIDMVIVGLKHEIARFPENDKAAEASVGMLAVRQTFKKRLERVMKKWDRKIA